MLKESDFSRDGIIDGQEYNKQSCKLLFLAKETNNPDQPGFDFRAWWHEEVKYAFSHRICEWAYGFFNGFPPIENFVI